MIKAVNKMQIRQIITKMKGKNSKKHTKRSNNLLIQKRKLTKTSIKNLMKQSLQLLRLSKQIGNNELLILLLEARGTYLLTFLPGILQELRPHLKGRNQCLRNKAKLSKKCNKSFMKIRHT